MKTKKLTLMLPVIALVACNNIGNKLTHDEATKRAQEIHDASQAFYLVGEGIEIKLDYKESTGKGDERQAIDSNYILKLNKKGDRYAKSKVNTTVKGVTVKADIEYYEIVDENDDKIFYVKYYDQATNTYATQVIDSNVIDNYYEITENFALLSEVPFSMAQSFLDPVTVIERFDEQYDEEEAYIGEIAYYSTGNNNLTMKISVDQKADNTEEEITTYGRATAYYDDGFFKSLNAKWSTSYGNKTDMKINMSYLEKLPITAPTDWNK